MNRERETAEHIVAAAVPEGHSLATGTQAEALDALLADERLALCTRSKRARIERFYRALQQLAHWASKTVRCLWGGRAAAYQEDGATPGLAEWLRIPRRTIGRYFRILQDWGYLVVVATGRRAEHCPRDVDGNAQETNEAPVYAFTLPRPTEDPQEPAPALVDENGTPPLEEGTSLKNLKFLTHTRAHESDHGSAADSFSGVAVNGPAPAAQVPWRPQPLWSARATPKLKRERRAAGAEIARLSFPLRAMSDKDIASVCREYFLAGWTVPDVLYAIDHFPDGSLWPHDGAPVTKDPRRLRGWLRRRLRAWKTEKGEVMRSRHQQLAAAQRQAKARRRAEQQRQLAAEAERATRVPAGSTPAEHQALINRRGAAVARAALREVAAKRNSRPHSY
ncbi:hypothetical protein [Arthrobacter sp. RCC_34]|uniref:hypothetical protein n=1 Tax=Arthrobacter sp. RCC_34 TaxID=3239230 RepID=UPI0035248ECC